MLRFGSEGSFGYRNDSDNIDEIFDNRNDIDKLPKKYQIDNKCPRRLNFMSSKNFKVSFTV